MEFYKAKLWGDVVNILFTGPNYFFFHSFYGLICIAERAEEIYAEGQFKTKFILYSGNKYADIDEECFAFAKQIINKYDQIHMKKIFVFEEIKTDLTNAHINVSYKV